MSAHDHDWMDEEIEELRSALPSSFIPDESDEIIQSLGEGLIPFSKLAARFERVGVAGNMWEHFRKIKLALLKERYRAEFVNRKEKVTDGRVDDLAHADPSYIQFVVNGLSEKEAYHEQHKERIDHYVALRELSNQGRR